MRRHAPAARAAHKPATLLPHPLPHASVGTVLFLGFPSLLEPAPAGAARTGLGAVQACLEVVQKRMRQHDGSFLQVGGRA